MEQKPCKNGAECENKGAEYTCNCKNGFTGKDCAETGENLHISIYTREQFYCVTVFAQGKYMDSHKACFLFKIIGNVKLCKCIRPVDVCTYI